MFIPGAGPPPCTTASRNRRRPAGVGRGAACCMVRRISNDSRKLPPRNTIAPSKSCALMRSATAWVCATQSISGELTTWLPRMPDQLRRGVGGSSVSSRSTAAWPSSGAQVAVEGARCAAALHVAEDRDPGVLAELVLQDVLTGRR